MKPNRAKFICVLAIDPSVSGFGYAVLEGPERLVDWGMKSVLGDKNTRSLKWVAHFIDLYQPDRIILENYRQGSRRCRRVQELIDGIRDLATNQGIKTRSFSRNDVRAAFQTVEARTKHEIAQVIGEFFPELASRVPPYRTCSMKEDDRINIFDAVALALAYFHFGNIQPLTDRRPPQLSLSRPSGAVSPGKVQDEEDARRLSCSIRAFPWLRPENISPQEGTPLEVKAWRY